MAGQEGSVGLDAKKIVYQESMFLVSNAGTTASPDATGTTTLTALVPADGAELLAATFTCTSPATVTVSGVQEWSIADASGVALATATTTVSPGLATGSVTSLTMGSATNGKNIATTGGAQLTLTNTETGTIADGVYGVFRFVWGL